MVASFATCAGSSRATAVRSPGRGGPGLRFSVAATVIVAVAIQLLQACTFGAPGELQTPEKLYAILAAAPYADDATVTGERWRVIDSTKLQVDHGYTCASAKRAAAKEYLGMRVYGSATLPSNFDGTVLLNGWYLEYASGDHHVLGLGSVIFDIARNGTELSWNAGGLLADHRGDDEYSWCYHYTVVAWAKNVGPPIGGLPKPHVDMGAIHADPTGKLVFVDKEVKSSRFTTKKARFKTTGAPPAGRALAGFGVSFNDDDHHLLQFGLDLGEAQIKRKKILWNTDVILKDNSTRSYGLGELATILTGESVHVWKPGSVIRESVTEEPMSRANDLQLSAADDANVCLGGYETSHTYSYKIEGVPFTWAVPMLTGWEVGVACDDEHVKRIGASIEDFAWERNPGDSTGTLYYTVRTILEDKNPDSELIDGLQVEVLGINLIEPPGNA